MVSMKQALQKPTYNPAQLWAKPVVAERTFREPCLLQDCPRCESKDEPSTTTYSWMKAQYRKPPVEMNTYLCGLCRQEIVRGRYGWGSPR